MVINRTIASANWMHPLSFFLYHPIWNGPLTHVVTVQWMTRRSICNWVQSIRNVQYAHHATSLTDSFSMCVCMSTRSIWGHEFKCPLDMMPFDTNRSMPIDCLLFHSLPLLMGLNRSGTRHIIGKLVWSLRQTMAWSRSNGTHWDCGHDWLPQFIYIYVVVYMYRHSKSKQTNADYWLYLPIVANNWTLSTQSCHHAQMDRFKSNGCNKFILELGST